MIPASLDEKAIVLIDDECVLCNSSAHYIIRHDKENIFRITSLFSVFGKQLLLQHGYGNKELESVVLIWQKKIYSKSDAVVKILELSGKKFLAGFLNLFPKVIRDFIYDLVSKYRYAIFGKSKMCEVPDELYKSRFI